MKKGTSRARKKSPTSASRVGRDDILPEYDFSQARPNPYAQRYTAGANVVELDPDVAAIFPSAEAVNHALRALAGIIQDHQPKERGRMRKDLKSARAPAR